MTDDSKNSRHKRDEKSRSNGGKPTPGSTNSSSVREFIYLDLPKLFSYLSQIRGGRQLLIQRVEQQFRVDEKSEPTQRKAVEKEVDAALSGHIPLIADGNIHSGHTETSETISGDIRSRVGKIGQRITVDTIHHEALRLVQDELGSRLVSLTGHIEIADFTEALGFMGKYPSFIEKFNKLTKSDLETAPNTDEMTFILSLASEDRILILLRLPSGKISTTYTSREHFTSDIQNITDNYGIRPRVKFTIIGLDATPASHNLDFSEQFHQNHPDGEGMGKSVIGMIQQMENLLSFWQLKSKDSHLFPIAIYREL